MNQTINILKTRRSIKKFLSDPVPENILEQIVEAGTYAPTSRGQQNPVIIAVTNKKLRGEIVKENAKVGGWGQDFDPFYGAPVILLIAVKASPNAVYDGSCVISNLLNAAWALGVGSCWIHRAKEELENDFGKNLLKSLGIDGDYIGVGHVALGYFAGENPAPKPRKENYVYWVK